MSTKWTKRWNSWINPTPVLPGVFERKEGGFVVRQRTTIRTTGKKKEIRMVLPEIEHPADALVILQREVDAVRGGGTATQSKPLFSEYAASLFERKVTTREIKSAAGRRKWTDVLGHLIPAFGRSPIDEIGRADVEAWRLEMGRQMTAGSLSPWTANTRLGVLRVIVRTMVAEYGLDRDPILGVRDFDTSEHQPYSEEEPNSLTPEEIGPYLERFRQEYPQHFAMVALGFGTGLRPSTLRPLRRSGSHPDVLWDRRTLLVRQSQTYRDEVMGTTKTGIRQRLVLPADLFEVLRWHVARLPAGPMRESELLFPSTTGGFLSRSTLDKPMARVARLIDLGKHITPKAMRRTFQDLCRAAEVPDVVTRAVSGHATEAMQRRYSTVNDQEMEGQLGKVVSLFGLQKPASDDQGKEVATDASGMQGGMHTPANEKTG